MHPSHVRRRIIGRSSAALLLSSALFGATGPAHSQPEQPAPAPAAPPAEPEAQPQPRPAVSETDAPASPIASEPTAEPVGSPVRATTSKPSPPAAAAAAGTCGASQLRTIAAELEPAVARVLAPGGAGIGLAVGSGRRVITALSLVKAGRGVQVRFGTDGPRYDASIVAIDEAHGLALLELETGAASRWASVAPRNAELGDPVISVGLAVVAEHFDVDEDLALQPGNVVTRDAVRLRSDAFESPHLERGSPLVDCEGRLLSMTTGFHDADVGPPTEVIRTLLADADQQEPYTGSWSIAHPSLAFMVHIDHSNASGYDSPNRWFGARFGTAVIGHDQWYFPLRFGVLALGGPEPDGELADRDGIRLQAETGFGYRAMLKGGAVPVYLVPQITAVLSWQSIQQEVTALSVDTSQCPPGGTCPVQSTYIETEDDLLRVMPAAGLSLGFGFAEVGYQLQLDVEELNRSVHQIGLGAQF